MDIQSLKIGLLGTGKMGSAIAAGLKSKHNVTLYSYDPYAKSELTVPAASALDLEDRCDVILICVKPQDAEKSLAGFKGNKYYISIMAGVSTGRLGTLLGPSAVTARAMPNLNAAVQRSATGLFCADEKLRSIAAAIFVAAGQVEFVEKEDLLHAVTGLSGSGPAYVFEFLDALAQGGVDRGLPYARALSLAIETVAGSAEYLRKANLHPLELRSNVTSPGGTTIAGLGALEENGFRSAVMQAVIAAAKRSTELSG